MGTFRHTGRSRNWVAAVCVMFALLLVMQAMHVHFDDGLSATKCQICVSAHSSAPVSAMIAEVLFFAIASIAILGELQAPDAVAVLPLFIRPPPTK